MGGETPLRPHIYDKQISVWFTDAEHEKLCQAAKDKGYGSQERYCIKLKRPKTGAARLVREIVEDWLNRK